jgi:hypothetical protein
MWCDEGGLAGGVWETHALRWIPLTVNNQSVAVRLENERGKMKLMQVKVMATGRRMATQDIV